MCDCRCDRSREQRITISSSQPGKGRCTRFSIYLQRRVKISFEKAKTNCRPCLRALDMTKRAMPLPKKGAIEDIPSACITAKRRIPVQGKG